MKYGNDKLESLFDEKGYRIPKGSESDFCNPFKSYGVGRAILSNMSDYRERLDKNSIIKSLGIKAELFKRETERLLKIIKNYPLISNIVKGPYFPIIIWPELFKGDLGKNLDKWLMSIVGEEYEETISIKLCNKCNGPLVNQVSFVEESKREQLIKKIQGDSIVGLYFPTALQGFSVKAAREQMTTLPEGFFLSGLDIIIALIMYPEILKDSYTACLELSALKYSNNHSFAIKNVEGGEIFFSNINFLSKPYSIHSSGLLFVG